jgi:hypothetical protein
LASSIAGGHFPAFALALLTVLLPSTVLGALFPLVTALCVERVGALRLPADA